MNIVWAYHTFDLPGNGLFAQHTTQTRGGMEYTFIQDTKFMEEEEMEGTETEMEGMVPLL